MATYNAKKLTIVKGADTYIIDPLQGNESVFIDIPVTIGVSSWSVTSPYTYVFQDSHITANSAINVWFKDGIRNGLIGDLKFTKSTGAVTFVTDELPVGDVPLLIRVIDAAVNGVYPIDAGLIETDAVVGETTVQGALEDLDERVDKKVDIYQGVENADKILGIGNDGNVTPVTISSVTGEVMTGATATTDGTSGMVPKPLAGDQAKVLTGGGSWEVSPGAKLVEVNLTTVTNVSGSYSGITEDDRITADMKCIMLEVGTPTAFKDSISVTTGAGMITLTCANVVGTSTVKATFQKVITDQQTITSTEFDILNNRLTAIENVCTEQTVVIHTSDWSSTAPYTYEWASSLITANSDVEVTPDDGADEAGIREFDAVKSTGKVTFTVDSLPTGDLPVIVKIINAKPNGLQSLDASDISTEAISGADNVEEALGTLGNNLASIAVAYGTFSTSGSDGAINLLRDDYIVLSAFAESYVLVPYVRPNETRWCIRIAGGNAYSGSCTVAYVRKS